MLNSTSGISVERLTELVYELLDAHEDTVRIAHELDACAGWDAHLDYLRGLQRVGREAIARAATPSSSTA